MNPFLLKVFGMEAEWQARFVVIGANHLEAPPTTTHTWCALQTILVSVANLSKLFWGSSGRKAEERALLRKRYGVGDDSPLRDPDLRNDFERFDERLWSHFAEEQNKVFSGRSIGPPWGAIQIPGTSHFGRYDHKRKIVIFWDREVSLPEIIEEAKNLLPPEDRGGWEPTVPR